MAIEDDNFFSRWSRRKAQVRSGEALPPEPAPPVVRATPATDAKTGGLAAPGEPPLATDAAPLVPAPPAPTPPTLDDVAKLTPHCDFKRFVGQGVSPEVRNAAVKKLFADPHFNVMDGLDIYIDDYSKPSPLSAAMMAKMVGAQFLKLVDDPNEPRPVVAVVATTEAPLTEAADDTPPAETSTDPSEPLAPPTARADEPNQTPPHDHADLQLQPDHAPEREGAGRGAG